MSINNQQGNLADLEVNSLKIEKQMSDFTEFDAVTKQFVEQKVSDLVDGAPAILDTLKELSTALGSDANFATTVASNIAAESTRAQAAEAKEVSDRQGAVSQLGEQLENAVASEAVLRSEADDVHTSAIASEVARATAAEAKEVSDRTLAMNALSSNLTNDLQLAIEDFNFGQSSQDLHLENNIQDVYVALGSESATRLAKDAEEKSARQAGDSALSEQLSSEIVQREEAVASEASTREQKITEEKNARIAGIAVETSARISAVSSESIERKAADSLLSEQVSAEVVQREQAVQAEQDARILADEAETQARASAIASEQSARIAAVSAEASARQSGDSALTENLAETSAVLHGAIDEEKAQRESKQAEEKSSRIAADSALSASIASESTARQNADNKEILAREGADLQEQQARQQADEQLEVQIGSLQSGKFEKSDNYEKRADGNLAIGEASYLYIGNAWRLKASNAGTQKKLEFEYSENGTDWNTAVPFIRGV